MKKALRAVIERYELPVRLTAQQDMLLTDVDPAWKADIMATLQAAGVKDASEVDSPSLSMACRRCRCAASPSPRPSAVCPRSTRDYAR